METKRIFIHKPPTSAHAAKPTAQPASLEEQVIEAMRQVYDPEIPVNVYDLGLVYKLSIDAEGVASVDMTLTAPGCPVADSLPKQLAEAIQSVEGISTAHVELVWEPPWDQDRMSDEAKFELGLF